MIIFSRYMLLVVEIRNNVIFSKKTINATQDSLGQIDLYRILDMLGSF